MQCRDSRVGSLEVTEVILKSGKIELNGQSSENSVEPAQGIRLH